MSMRDRLNRKMAGFSADVESRLSQLEPPSPAPSAPTASSGAAEVPPGTLREPRTGIGRAAFFSDRIAELERDKLGLAEALEVAQRSGAIIEIPLDQLDDNPEQAEAVYDNDYVAELAAAWQAGSEPPPIEVRQQGERYVILSGHHRKRAAGLAGFVSIKARVLAVDDARSADMVYTSNAVRKRPDWINARFFARRRLDTLPDGTLRFPTQKELARHFAVREPAMSALLQMLKLPGQIQALLDARPDLFNFTTATEVVLPAVEANPERVAEIVECIRRLESGLPQSALKGLIAQSLKPRGEAGGRPSSPTKVIGSKQTGFVRAFKERRFTVTAGPGVDLDAFRRELDEFLEKRAKVR